MKRILILPFLFLLLVASCTTIHKKNDVPAIKMSHDTLLPNNKKEIIRKTPVPDWLKKKYPKVNNDEKGLYERIVHFSSLNNSVSFCIREVQEGGVCMFGYLTIFIDKKEADNIIIAEGCDQDFGNPKHSYVDYELIRNNVILSMKNVERVPDSLLDKEGRMELGKTIEDYKLIRTTQKIFYKILDSGLIESTIGKVKKETF